MNSIQILYWVSTIIPKFISKFLVEISVLNVSFNAFGITKAIWRRFGIANSIIYL